MDVSLQVYRSGAAHKLTVIARPGKAAALGEFLLVEGADLGLPDDPTAVDCLRAAYRVVAQVLNAGTVM